jgi:hypothetical protein
MTATIFIPTVVPHPPVSLPWYAPSSSSRTTHHLRLRKRYLKENERKRADRAAG